MRVPVDKIGWLLEQVQKIGAAGGLTLYSIHLRSAGWAIEWYDSRKQGANADWRTGLVVHGYHVDLGECLANECDRLISEKRGQDLVEGIQAVRDVLRSKK